MFEQHDSWNCLVKFLCITLEASTVHQSPRCHRYHRHHRYHRSMQQSYRCFLGSILSELDAVSSGLMPLIHGVCGDGPRWTAFLPRIPAGRLWVLVSHSRPGMDVESFKSVGTLGLAVDFLSIRNFGCWLTATVSRFKASLNHHVSIRTPLTKWSDSW